MVSRPTCTAVRASISTPVRPRVSACTVMCTALADSSSANSTATRVSGSGWHSGTSSAVRLLAWMAAMRAMPSTSPFLAVPLATRARVAGSMRMLPRGPGHAVGLALGRHVHHVGLAFGVEMGEGLGHRRACAKKRNAGATVGGPGGAMIARRTFAGRAGL
jgi:hypothetical protein